MVKTVQQHQCFMKQMSIGHERIFVSINYKIYSVIFLFRVQEYIGQAKHILSPV
ncbi:hypothetical protein FLA_1934 [Filimonas lacunae]|nr:hypothetical protein FLA_1934 [Filimonas lacunae]